MLSCGCLDNPRPSDSEEGLRNSPSGQASRQEMAEMMNRCVQRQEEWLTSTSRIRANVEALNREVEAFHRLERSPPPYVTPPASQSEVTVHPNALRVSPMRNVDSESERATYRPDPTGQTFGRVQYTRAQTTDRFAFTPVPVNSPVVSEPHPLPNPPAATDDNP